MENILKEIRVFKKNTRRQTAKVLITVMLCLNLLPTYKPIQALAYNSAMGYPGTDMADDLSAEDDLWETLESQGEVVLSFPSQIEAEISSPDDEDDYSFRLDAETDLTVSLESEYPCGLELLSEGSVIGASYKPYSQILEPSELDAGTYKIRVVPQAGTAASSYRLRIARKADRTKMPDYSEAHMAGTIFDTKSPFRFSNIQNARDRQANSLTLIHYLAHWQGPVDESVMPFYDKGGTMGTPSDYIHYKEAEPEFHSQNVFYLPVNDGSGEHVEHWKNAIMTYGSIGISYLTSYNFGDTSEEPGLPELDFEYYYAPEDLDYDWVSGHLITIVGWDDTIEKENFRVTQRDMDYNTGELGDSGGAILNQTMPKQDGAWICHNSAGENDPVNPPYFYVSYECCEFGGEDEEAFVVSPGEKNDNYNHLYSNSAGGISGPSQEYYGYLKGEQVFHNEGKGEVLRAVGFALPVGEVDYEIEVSIGSGPAETVQTGHLIYPGLHTVRLENGILIPEDTDFKIGVALSGDDDQYLSFFTCCNSFLVDGIKDIPGKSFYYSDGKIIDASAEGDYPCIYAYTYSSSKQKFTLLDNREPLDDSPQTAAALDGLTATPANALAKATADTLTAAPPKTAATPSNIITAAPPNPTTSTPSDATTATPANALTAATSSDAEYPPNGDEMILEDDREDTRQAKRPEEEWKETLDSLHSRYRIEDFLSLKNAVISSSEPLGLNLPEKYDSRDYNLVTRTKNQGSSFLCWAFASIGILETSYLRYGNQLINFPRGINLLSEEEPITDGTISLKLKKGQQIPLSLTASLYSDSDYFTPGTPQIYWEISGDVGSVEQGENLSESGAETTVLTAEKPGIVTVTAVSMADVSLKASCRIEITETAPAKVSIKPERLTMGVGETQQLEVTVEAEETLTVLYSSDRPDVVSVDKNGRVFALKPGTAIITAKAGDGTAVCRITVRRYSDSDDDDGGDAGTGDRWSAGIGNQAIEPDTIRGAWESQSGGWRFKKEDGTYAASSWERIGGLWYYFREDSFAATGWLYDPSYQRWFYLEENCAMAVGWRQIDGKWYYFHTVSDGGKGKMYAGEPTPDGFMTGSDGAWVE